MSPIAASEMWEPNTGLRALDDWFRSSVGRVMVQDRLLAP
jgi:hypothetical protein